MKVCIGGAMGNVIIYESCELLFRSDVARYVQLASDVFHLSYIMFYQ